MAAAGVVWGQRARASLREFVPSGGRHRGHGEDWKKVDDRRKDAGDGGWRKDEIVHGQQKD